MIVIVMGVSGSGKSTVGALLAQRLGWRFYEGDDFHPPANIDKMAAGVALTDEDRYPWLTRLKGVMDECRLIGADAVLACSALRSRYRRYLVDGAPDVRFVYLRGDEKTLRSRLAMRSGHYMRAGMLASQLATLEEPAEDGTVVVDVDEPPWRLVSRIATVLTA